MTIHIDIGGEGRHVGAINVNPYWKTSTTGAPGRPIPNLVLGVGERLPFAAAVADVITVEHAPIRPGTAAEIARVLKPDGVVNLTHPTSYALAGAHDAVAAALGVAGPDRAAALSAGTPELFTVLRRGVGLLR